ncbi:arsenical pump-driving ATPase [uncultured Selenomonas sp.]|uniref:arsenical pump-driving ATPase n=1 Tax=uncultured Selenomonas sp. TaxID=159275 RepID=UPI0025890CB5|nr:arsenical pump-driving ATPase [uncultured Selenomonas sp.]
MERFDPASVVQTKYLFFTGKGGVGKTSTACATAVYLADHGKRVLLVSTDPASNLQDVFSLALDRKGTEIPQAPGLFVANLDPIKAAEEYRESVVAAYRSVLPEAAIENMREQLSGSCTTEIAAFNEFSSFLTDEALNRRYDHIIFDTAPTGHTLRLLQLPSAWSGFIEQSKHGASCLGQLSGLADKRKLYETAVRTLSDGGKTTLLLVARLEETPLKEAERAAEELRGLGILRQVLILNAIAPPGDDAVSVALYEKQRQALAQMPEGLRRMDSYEIPLRAYNITGIAHVRDMLRTDHLEDAQAAVRAREGHRLSDLVDDLVRHRRKVIFTMGKGGVGKTTIAAAIALALAERGECVHLATTDPAAHLKFVLDEGSGIRTSYIDEKKELKKYQEDVIREAMAGGIAPADLDYIKEDLRSPCTQEIAVFRAFAEIVAQAEDEIVVIDTAPTGHTLLLLESTAAYDRELKRSQGKTPASVKKLLPRLKSEETETVIVTLPEATPVYEAERLREDLQRAQLQVRWWVVNRSFLGLETKNPLLRARAAQEAAWIDEVNRKASGREVLIPWKAESLKGAALLSL